MNFNDRPEFGEKLKEMARGVGRPIDDTDMKAYFNQLEDYPISLVLKAMDKALHDRDPDDLYLRTMLITVPEILAAINDLMRPPEGEEGRVSRCKKCNGDGWLTSVNKLGQMRAIPCECLYHEAKEKIKKKGKMRHDDSYRAWIIMAFEYHEKNYGGLKSEEGKP